MKKALKMITALCTGLILAVTEADIHPIHADEEKETVRILFTNDLNDHILASNAEIVTYDSQGNRTQKTESAGGYAYLTKVIERYKEDNAVLLDAGNFSNGQGFDFLFSDEAPDLEMLGRIGYDAVTLGEREFQYGAARLVYMLKKASGKTQVLMANMSGKDTDGGKDFAEACGDSGNIVPYTVIERAGIKIGVFGIMDETEGKRLSTGDDIAVEDAQEAAEAAIEALKKEGAQLIICLDHGASADASLAKKVSGIDVLICSNNYEGTEEVCKVGNTVVVSAGYNGWYLGVLDIDIHTKEPVSYGLKPVTKSVGSNSDISTKALDFWKKLDTKFLKGSGYTNSIKICENEVEFTDVRENYTEFGNSNMGDLVADAYVRSLHYVTNDYSFAVGITDRASVGDALPRGNVTVRDVLEAACLNSGYDGKPGSSLLAVYMTGKDLRKLCEYDVSFAREDYPEEQMYFSGLKYVYSDKRPLQNRVEEVYVEEARGYWVPVTNSKYYRVVLNREIALRKDCMKERSGGYLDIQYCYENREPIEHLETAVLQAEEKEFKAWQGLCMELVEAVRNEKAVPVVSESYTQARDVKKEDANPGFFEYLKNPSDWAVHRYKTWGIALIAAIAAWKTARAIWDRRRAKD